MSDIPIFSFGGEINWIPFEDAKGRVFNDGGASYTVTRAPKMTEEMAEQMAKWMLRVGPPPDWLYPLDK